jgi:hypothetical protein
VLVKPGEFDSKLDQLFRLIPEQGGYVSGSNAETQAGQLRSGIVTFRVPADKFQITLNSVRRLGTVQVLNIGGTDVSEEYVDLQARLRSMEAQRDATTALLKQATSVQEILNVQQQLGRQQEVIERVQGRINYLDHAVAYSTLAVTLREGGVPIGEPPVDEWGFRTALVQAVHNFVGVINFGVMALGTIGPLLVFAAGMAAIFWRRRPRPGTAL